MGNVDCSTFTALLHGSVKTAQSKVSTGTEKEGWLTFLLTIALLNVSFEVNDIIVCGGRCFMFVGY